MLSRLTFSLSQNAIYEARVHENGSPACSVKREPAEGFFAKPLLCVGIGVDVDVDVDIVVGVGVAIVSFRRRRSWKRICDELLSERRNNQKLKAGFRFRMYNSN